MEECEEKEKPNRRKEDSTINAICDKLKEQTDTLSNQDIKLDNHEVLITDVIKLHKEALDLHKETHQVSIKNRDDIKVISHKQDILAAQTSPIIETLTKISDAVSALAWLNSKARWVWGIFLTIGVYSTDALDKLIDAIAKGH